MGVNYNPRIVTNGLALALDAGNTRSYPGSGTAWNDLSSNSVGSLVNGPTYSSINGGCIVFDGANDYITAPMSCNKTYYSVEWWLYPTSVSNYNQTILFDGGWGDFVWHTTSSGSYYVGTSASNSTTRIENADPGSVAINKWQQWVWTFNNGIGSVYKNGSFLRSQSGLPLAARASFTTFSTNLGGAGPIAGNLSNIKVYSNKVLSADEVVQNFNTIRGRYEI
jgi:hypothetical protein